MSLGSSQALRFSPLCHPKCRDWGLLQCSHERPPDPTLGSLVVEQMLLHSPAFCLPLCHLHLAKQLCWEAGTHAAFQPAIISAEAGGLFPA